MPDDVRIRRSTAADRPGIFDLAQRSLGWKGDERDREFFEWKHDLNPAGQSPAWVGEIDGEIVGFRTMQRWVFRSEDRTPMHLVRAVDTATHPDHQGKGIFRRLTMAAVEALTLEGTDAVFNTPNSSSRPGYLKMGWSIVGRPTLWVHPQTPATVVRMLRARVAAEKWSEPVDVGVPAADALAEMSESSLTTRPRSGRIGPHPTIDSLRWRYSFEPLHYRAVEVRGGAAIVRVRRRGPLREVALCEWLSPTTDPRGLRRLVQSCGDYLVAVGLGPRHGLVPLPRQGPVVTWRPLARAGVPTLSDVDFALGDLELF